MAFARVHDYLLGGQDCYRADRELADALRRACPPLQDAVNAARLFVTDAAHKLTAAGIRQFLVFGAGYPRTPDVHDVAPESRLLYVDSDPNVAVYRRALTSSSGFLTADISDLDEVFADGDELLDFTKPVAVVVSSVLEFVSDAVTALNTLSCRLAAGSYLVFSHITADTQPEQMARVADLCRGHGIDFTPRSRAAVDLLLAEYDLTADGVVCPDQWVDDDAVTWLSPAGSTSSAPRVDVPCYAAIGRLRTTSPPESPARTSATTPSTLSGLSSEVMSSQLCRQHTPTRICLR